MKTPNTHFVDALSPFVPASHQPHSGAMLVAMVRQAVNQAEHVICGNEQETARAAYLAEAIDQSDLERRASAWERAQALYRALPPVM